MPWLRSLPFLVLLALAGCATKYAQQTLPPEHLLLPCPVPAVQAETNGALARTVLAFKRALQDCNDDKAALREWAKEN